MLHIIRLRKLLPLHRLGLWMAVFAPFAIGVFLFLDDETQGHDDITAPTLDMLPQKGPMTITVTSSGCFHHEVRRFHLASNVMRIEEQHRSVGEDDAVVTSWVALGELKVSADDVLGLDRWVGHVATAKGGCTSSVEVDIAGADGQTLARHSMSDCSALPADVLSPSKLVQRLSSAQDPPAHVVE